VSNVFELREYSLTLPPRLHAYCSIAIQLQFPKPLRAFWQFGYGKAFHRLNEFGFDFWRGHRARLYRALYAGGRLVIIPNKEVFPRRGNPNTYRVRRHWVERGYSSALNDSIAVDPLLVQIMIELRHPTQTLMTTTKRRLPIAFALATVVMLIRL
jgi:hypothetical protein